MITVILSGICLFVGFVGGVWFTTVAYGKNPRKAIKAMKEFNDAVA